MLAARGCTVSSLTLLLTRNLLLPLSLLSCTWHLFLSAFKMFSVSLKMKVKAAQPCLTLCDPMDYTVHGILQARILEWGAFPFSRGSSWPRNWTRVSHIAGRFFTSWATREVSVSLALTYLIIMCFGISFSLFLMLGIHWPSWLIKFWHQYCGRTVSINVF